MNKEFKKIKSVNETRYVLESASVGGTSAGAVASVPAPLGKIIKRNPKEELLKVSAKQHKNNYKNRPKTNESASTESLIAKLVRVAKQAGQEQITADSIHRRKLAKALEYRTLQAIEMLKKGSLNSEAIRFIKGVTGQMEDLIQTKESAPKGWEGTVKAMKKHKEIDNPYALTNWMKNKEYKSHAVEDVYIDSLFTKLNERLKK
jgi:hypothetical protein